MVYKRLTLGLAGGGGRTMVDHSQTFHPIIWIMMVSGQDHHHHHHDDDHHTIISTNPTPPIWLMTVKEGPAASMADLSISSCPHYLDLVGQADVEDDDGQSDQGLPLLLMSPSIRIMTVQRTGGATSIIVTNRKAARKGNRAMSW